MADKTLVQIQDLKMYFENRKGWFGKQVEYVKAVDGVSLDIKKGETVGLVGSTGNVTGPHLHLELKYGKMHLNPAYYVEFLTGE